VDPVLGNLAYAKLPEAKQYNAMPVTTRPKGSTTAIRRHFKTTELPVRYLIYIAITALGRVLIEIVGAEHRTGTDLLIVVGAILALSFAVLVLRLALAKTIRPKPQQRSLHK